MVHLALSLITQTIIWYEGGLGGGRYKGNVDYYGVPSVKHTFVHYYGYILAAVKANSVDRNIDRRFWLLHKVTIRKHSIIYTYE